MVEIPPICNESSIEVKPRKIKHREEKTYILTVNGILRNDFMTRRIIQDFPLNEFEHLSDVNIYLGVVNVHGGLNSPRMVSWTTNSPGKSSPERVILRKPKKLVNEVLKAETDYLGENYTSLYSMRGATYDTHQRQPLLPLSNLQNQNTYSANKKMRNAHDLSSGTDRMDRSVAVDLDFDGDHDADDFPKERKKTLVAFGIMATSMVITLLSLSLVHERLPDRSTVGPLPDVFLDNFSAYDWALDVSEYILLIYMIATAVFMVLHKHRYILFRRVFLMMSVLYLYRAITMYVTVLPVSSKTYYCSPKSDHLTFLELTKRVLMLMSGIGLSVNGQHKYCGDFIYSGHTVVLVLCHLVIAEYTPGKVWLVHCVCIVPTCLGILMLMLSHGHYTVDIVIAYYVTTRLFWLYHVLANNTSLKQLSHTNYLSREWWFRIFIYFEKNVNGIVPNEFEWPLPWPRRR